MTNWQTFTINKIVERYYDACLVFYLDRNFDNVEDRVLVHRGELYTTFQEGDMIEIDVDNYKKRLLYKKREFESIYVSESDNVVRKVSSAVIPANSSSEVVIVNPQMSSNQVQEIGNNMINRAEQSGGQYEVEFTAREEYRDNGSVSARQMSWVYRKSK